MVEKDLTTASVVRIQAVVYTLVTTGICINSILNCWAISKFSSYFGDCGLGRTKEVTYAFHGRAWAMDVGGVNILFTNLNYGE